jgi:F-type H+-transporting ATPase subunit b
MDSTFWVFVALILFLMLVTYLGLPGMLTKSLDQRSKRIADEIDEARRLREEAQAMLASYQRKQKEAEAEAQDIVASAKTEAERFARESREKLEAQMQRRTKMAEDKIAQAEQQAANEVRATAAAVAVAAARQVIDERVDAGRDARIVDTSIEELGAKL